jgi:DNA-binding MarR family transcriptional regulator
VPDAADIPRRKRTPHAQYKREVAGFTAAGADETVQRVVTAISRVSKRLDSFYREQLAAEKLHRGDWAVLQALGVHGTDGCLTPSTLADLGGVSPSTMTHRLDLLATRGLIERAVDQDNRTRSNVRLTRSGWQLFQQVIQDAEVVESNLLDPLSRKEQVELADLLERLLKGLDPRSGR